MTRKSKIFDFEGALRELEALIKRMESGELPLEESLKQFERGMALTRACQKALAEAEQKVKLLTQEQGEQKLTPFEREDNDADR
ncbi:MAG: exodeoxyribonuclease VII small subunit [Gammaproteobacteria bacterium]